MNAFGQRTGNHRGNRFLIIFCICCTSVPELVTDQNKLSEPNADGHEQGVFHKLTRDALETHQALSSFNDMNNQKRHRSSSSVSTGSTSSSSSSSSSLSPRKKMKRRKRRLPCPQVGFGGVLCCWAKWEMSLK